MPFKDQQGGLHVEARVMGKMLNENVKSAFTGHGCKGARGEIPMMLQDSPHYRDGGAGGLKMQQGR